MTTNNYLFEYHIEAILVTLVCCALRPKVLVPTSGQGWMRHSREEEGRKTDVMAWQDWDEVMLTLSSRSFCQMSYKVIN